jgi:hypothetical protein
MSWRINEQNLVVQGLNRPLFACPIFPPYFVLIIEVGVEHTWELQRFFTGNIRRVFHNIYRVYESNPLSIYQNGRAHRKQLSSWIGA